MMKRPWVIVGIIVAIGLHMLIHFDIILYQNETHIDDFLTILLWPFFLIPAFNSDNILYLFLSILMNGIYYLSISRLRHMWKDRNRYLYATILAGFLIPICILIVSHLIPKLTAYNVTFILWPSISLLMVISDNSSFLLQNIILFAFTIITNILYYIGVYSIVRYNTDSIKLIFKF